MLMHFADLFETVADALPSMPALVHGSTIRSWREYDERAARLAAGFAAAGLKPDSKIALYARNSNEYLESQFACFKSRTIAINVNYRYTDAELLYILDNSEAQGVVYFAEYAARIAAVREKLPRLKFFLEVPDTSGLHLEGASDYETVIAQSPQMPRIARSEDDIYMLYTGGTTGMPKGVMYRMGDFCRGRFRTFALRGLKTPETSAELAGLVRDLHVKEQTPASLPVCPLMHGAGLWLGAFQPHFLGARVVTMAGGHFDPDAVWKTIERERVTEITMVGDPFARPLLAALRKAAASGRPYDVGSLKRITSSGVMLSVESKRGLLEFCDATVVDLIGSTEGSIGMSVMNRSTPAVATAHFLPNETTKVFTEDGQEVAPGSGAIGKVASSGAVPIGYFKDAEKTANTFREIGGTRYAFAGDYGTVAADGSLLVLGRGSNCINTGGEKVFPEEVEESLKAHKDVLDCLVVGVPDETFVERVVAVVSLRPGATVEDNALIDASRQRLAGYKLPKAIIRAARISRAANGKADYKWAKEMALRGQGTTDPGKKA